MDNCVFCEIVKGTIPSSKIWEDDKYMAFLDIRPSTKGMTLVIPKFHYDSYIYKTPENVVQELFLASKKVVSILEKAFDTERVAVVAEGMGVNHLHLKLYPLHGVKGKFMPMESKEVKYFEKYNGYVTTQLGPNSSPDELNKLAEYIRSFA